MVGKSWAIRMADLVLDAVDERDDRSVRPGNDVLVDGAVEDILGGEAALGVAVFSGLGHLDVSDLITAFSCISMCLLR